MFSAMSWLLIYSAITSSVTFPLLATTHPFAHRWWPKIVCWFLCIPSEAFVNYSLLSIALTCLLTGLAVPIPIGGYGLLIHDLPIFLLRFDGRFLLSIPLSALLFFLLLLASCILLSTQCDTLYHTCSAMTSYSSAFPITSWVVCLKRLAYIRSGGWPKGFAWKARVLYPFYRQ